MYYQSEGGGLKSWHTFYMRGYWKTGGNSGEYSQFQIPFLHSLFYLSIKTGVSKLSFPNITAKSFITTNYIKMLKFDFISSN